MFRSSNDHHQVYKSYHVHVLIMVRNPITFHSKISLHNKNIKMDLREVGGGGGDWMELAQDRDRWLALVGTVRNLRVPKMRGMS